LYAEPQQAVPNAQRCSATVLISLPLPPSCHDVDHTWLQETADHVEGEPDTLPSRYELNAEQVVLPVAMALGLKSFWSRQKLAAATETRRAATNREEPVP